MRCEAFLVFLKLTLTTTIQIINCRYITYIQIIGISKRADSAPSGISNSITEQNLCKKYRPTRSFLNIILYKIDFVDV